MKISTKGGDAIYEPSPDYPCPPKMMLWDMTNTEPPIAEDAAAQLRDFSVYAVERGKARSGGRVAVVSSKDVQFGMARMSALLAEVNHAAYSMRIFRDTEAALV